MAFFSSLLEHIQAIRAAAVALAIRDALIETPRATTDRLAHDLLQSALQGMDTATRETPTSGGA